MTGFGAGFGDRMEKLPPDLVPERGLSTARMSFAFFFALDFFDVFCKSSGLDCTGGLGDFGVFDGSDLLRPSSRSSSSSRSENSKLVFEAHGDSGVSCERAGVSPGWVSVTSPSSTSVRASNLFWVGGGSFLGEVGKGGGGDGGVPAFRRTLRGFGVDHSSFAPTLGL